MFAQNVGLCARSKCRRAALRADKSYARTTLAAARERKKDGRGHKKFVLSDGVAG